MFATRGMQRLAIERRSSTGLEYGLLGGLAAILLGIVFLHVGPDLAEALAAAVRNMRSANGPG